MSITIKERSFNIVAGPSKDVLFDCCKYLSRFNNPIKITFTVIAGYTAPNNNPGRAAVYKEVRNVSVRSIQHEDGSGESFNLEGYAEYEGARYKYKAYYSTKRRQGMMTFVLD